MKIKKRIGCDPELFLFDKVLDRIVPACGLVEGTKESPISLINGGMVQLDGTVLEFGTPPVLPSRNNFGKALKETLDIIRKQLSDKHGDRYELRCGATASYHPDDIGVNHSGFLVGCDPQYVLVDGSKPVRYILESVERLDRSCVPIGGHIHFGFADKMEGRKVQDHSSLRFIRAMNGKGLDFFIKDVECESTTERADTMAFCPSLPAVRVKEYGLEFRNLSSYWLASPKTASLFSKFHNASVERAKHEMHSFGDVARDIATELEKLSAKIAEQPAKYQQTLPLAY